MKNNSDNYYYKQPVSNVTKKCPICDSYMHGNDTEGYTCACGYTIVTLPHHPYTADQPNEIDDNIGGMYGWICPKCGAVMSPWTDCCPNCTNRNWEITYSTSNTSNYN